MINSVLDLFTIGIGPSSSHTVGPMRAARDFVLRLVTSDRPPARLQVELFGSLGLTGPGHGTARAVLLGLEGECPEDVDVGQIPQRTAAIQAERRIRLPDGTRVAFDPADTVIFNRTATLPSHPNGMRFSAWDDQGNSIAVRDYYSIGGGFVVPADEGAQPPLTRPCAEGPYPFATAAELLARCHVDEAPISRVVLEQERMARPESELRARLARIWSAMQDCVTEGCRKQGVLPGGLLLQRRAPLLYQELLRRPERSLSDPLTVLDWVTVYALAVSEENAAGGRVVTAPTNGAAGVVPAVLHYYWRFLPTATEEGVHRFLLTAGAIGMLYKRRASLSGAEVGCQGEIGVACSMAAAGLAEVMGGSVDQVENAAEIAMEHNLGLTCDPIQGLVQIPCIERNAMGAVKALSACRLALRGDGKHRISLDAVIATMQQTGLDMLTKYKETSLGGLAVNAIDC